MTALFMAHEARDLQVTLTAVRKPEVSKCL